MRDVSFPLEKLVWDSAFFGFKVGTCSIAANTVEQVRSLVAEVSECGTRLCYWNVRADDTATLAAAQAFAPRPVLIVGERVFLRCKVRRTDRQGGPSAVLYDKNRPVTQELLDLGLLAGQYSRFNRDLSIPADKFREMFHTWVRLSVERSIADDVFVTEINSSIAGIITVKYDPLPRIGLVAVKQMYQSQGHGSALLSAVFSACEKRHHKEVDIVTQGDNSRALSFYKQKGFVEIARERVYHIWTSMGFPDG